MCRSLYLHVGPPKTGTTFLQRVVLPQTNNLVYHVLPTVTFGCAEMRFGDLFLFSPDLWENTGGELLASLDDDASVEQDVLVSSEYIVGGVASPQPWTPDSEEEYGLVVRTDRETGGHPDHESFGNHIAAFERAARRQGFSQIRVLLTTRRQDEILASTYAQASNRVRGASQENFERWATHLTGDRAGFHLGGGQKLDYCRWWKTLTGVLGESNVLFLPFELLRESQTSFLKRWLAFMGVEGADSLALSLWHGEGKPHVNFRVQMDHSSSADRTEPSSNSRIPSARASHEPAHPLVTLPPGRGDSTHKRVVGSDTKNVRGG